MDNKILDIMAKLGIDNQVVIDTEDKTYTLYYGYKRGSHIDSIQNPLKSCKGIMYIRTNGKEIEIFNNTGVEFKSIKNVNQFDGFRNLVKELYKNGFRVDEHTYDEEMLGYNSSEIIDSEYNNVICCVEEYNWFSNSNILTNKEVFYTAYKNYEDQDAEDSYNIANCINFYETYENKEYLIIEEFDKTNFSTKTCVSFDVQDYEYIIENILTKCKVM